MGNDGLVGYFVIDYLKEVLIVLKFLDDWIFWTDGEVISLVLKRSSTILLTGDTLYFWSLFGLKLFFRGELLKELSIF